jgi:general stress protein YciG
LDSLFFGSLNLVIFFCGGDFLEEKKGKMTFAEAGRRGGLRTSETHGGEFYSEIGRKGGKIGGPKGGQRVRRLIQEGKMYEVE